VGLDRYARMTAWRAHEQGVPSRAPGPLSLPKHRPKLKLYARARPQPDLTLIALAIIDIAERQQAEADN